MHDVASILPGCTEVLLQGSTDQHPTQTRRDDDMGEAQHVKR